MPTCQALDRTGGLKAPSARRKCRYLRYVDEPYKLVGRIGVEALPPQPRRELSRRIRHPTAHVPPRAVGPQKTFEVQHHRLASKAWRASAAAGAGKRKR
jgi:hypothetical protein